MPSEPISWSPVSEAELPELSGLLTAIEHFDEPSERHTIEELQEAYAEHGADPARNARLGRDSGGTLVAYGWLHPFPADTDPRRVFLAGGVHPGWRRRGIGHELLDWQIARAGEWYNENRRPEHGPLELRIAVEDKLADRAALIADRGFSAVRWFADMTCRFDELPSGLPAVPELPGIRIEPYSAEVSEEVREAHNEAFSDHWGSQPIPQIRWQEDLSAASTRPEWSWIAVDTDSGRIAGYAMSSAYQQDWEFQGFREGWTDRLGVRRDWRNRGIAKALLIASMHSFADAGLDAAGLGVDTDNPSGAFGLYARLGYERGETQVMYARTEHGS
ncbi:GNAT family N-acetyltransferase [Microlunatus soli]|uniref:Mycothiol synthase n=1 Tax=Microlunatus soli TaxID=630515 RepID=A0A1H2A690_9ACTN|nr:GNAT family N-acetyltransferase [Microlunatus soli]SDT41470.1 mycothiol synthase [Microlunatus soli]